MQLEKAYGEYTDFWKDVIKQFFTKSIKPEMYGKVYVAILSNHMMRSGVPCIASIKLSIQKSIASGEIANPYKMKDLNSNSFYDYASMEEFKYITDEERQENVKKLKGLFKHKEI